ncbi:MAG TPA: FeS-binding protein, partial [Fibrella sp.]
MHFPSFLRPAGLGLFLLGFAVFIYILTLGRFQLTGDVLKQTLKPEHQTVLQPRLAPLLNKTYDSNLSFISDIRGIINTYNSEQEAKQNWKAVIYDDYLFDLTKCSTIGGGPASQSNDHSLWFWLSIGLAA